MTPFPYTRFTTSTPARQVLVRPLAWETKFFGECMGALEIVTTPQSQQPQARVAVNRAAQAKALQHELTNALHEAKLDGYRHMSLRVTSDDAPAIWAAEQAGLRLMDVAVDLTIKLSRTSLPPSRTRGHVARAGVPADIPAMQAMTIGAFGLTRFALDPFFSSAQVDHFYSTWAANLFSGLADMVLVAEIDGQLAGFVSCKLTGDNRGRIPLVATAASFRGRGIGGDLVGAALVWFADAGCDIAYVKTQTANYPAVAVYERAGFTACQSELTFTTTLNQARSSSLIYSPLQRSIPIE